MYYIEQQEEELVKYEVKINISKLLVLKHNIVTKCGEIIHHSYNSTDFPEYNDCTHLRNYHHEKIGKTEKYEEIYHIEYDEYKDTKLVTLIDKLIAGETQVISELKNPSPEIKENQEEKIIEEVKKVSNEIKMANSSTILKLTERLSELSLQLKQVQESKILNKDRKSDLEYYEETLSYIELIETSRIKFTTLEEFNSLYEKVEEFFTSTESKSIDSNINQNYYKKMVKGK